MIADVTLTLEVEEDLLLAVEEDEPIYLVLGEPFIGGAWPMYEGSYTIVPKAWEDQTLPTEKRSMEQDVTVKEIPYGETANPYGKTVTIGN